LIPISANYVERPRLRTAIAPHFAIGIGLCAGLLGAFLDASTAGREIERTLTRDWIIEARGKRTAPSGVAVVSMDESRPDRDAVARSDRRWSRHVYAALIERLSALDASAVALDVTFEDARDERADAALESALSVSANTVLFRRLARTTIGDASVPTLHRFAKAARVQAVFPLPKTPHQVEYFWPFFRLLEPRGVGGVHALVEMPSLPVAALQLAVLRELGADRFEQLLGAFRSTQPGSPQETETVARFEAHGSLTQAMLALRRELVADVSPRNPGEVFADVIETSAGDLPRTAIAKLLSLLNVYSEPDVLLLNFYGPTRTIKTLEHGEVLDARTETLDALRAAVSGRVVFVGHSGRSAVDQQDAYRTVYSRDDGVDLSGVEIAATAYANLVDGSTFRTLSPWTGAMLQAVFGVIVTLIVLCTGTRWALMLSAALAALYFAAAVYAATNTYLLLPVGVPLLVVLPLVLFFGLFHRHLRARRQRDLIQVGAGTMLPGRAVDDIEAGRIDQVAPVQLYGTCMITDIEGYTTVAESVTAEHLAGLTREYFAILTDLTRLNGGELIDLEGDSMTAVWTSDVATADTQSRATNAALAITRALHEFRQSHPDTPFSTRIGLHSGWMSATNIGGGNTYRHRVIGDVVNTASRLESLNKRLGTSVLASREVIADTQELLIRPVGTFLLKGKRDPLEVVEILDTGARLTSEWRVLCWHFDEALCSLSNREPDTAMQHLVDLLSTFETDGPSRFYLDLLRGCGPAGIHIDEHGMVTLDGT